METITRLDKTTYDVDDVDLRKLIDEGKIHRLPAIRGRWGYVEVDTTKGRRICPSCDKVIMGACCKCKYCGHVFWNRVNGINVFVTNDGHRRHCTKCGGWINRYEIVCGCGHHFEPMLMASIEIQAILPDGMTLSQMEGHIRKSIKSLRKGSQPGEPLWKLAEGDVKIIHKKTTFLHEVGDEYEKES